jgi:hypothetical protein
MIIIKKIKQRRIGRLYVWKTLKGWEYAKKSQLNNLVPVGIAITRVKIEKYRLVSVSKLTVNI